VSCGAKQNNEKNPLRGFLLLPTVATFQHYLGDQRAFEGHRGTMQNQQVAMASDI
jgi:hypothetical protein